MLRLGDHRSPKGRGGPDDSSTHFIRTSGSQISPSALTG